MKILSKLWLGITSLVLAIILIIWLFQVGLLNRFYIQERTNILLEEGEKIVSIINSKNKSMISQDIIDEIDSFESSVNAKVIIIDSKNYTLYINDPPLEEHNIKDRKYKFKNEIESFLENEEVKKRIREGKTFIKQNKDSRFNRKFITVLVPIYKDKQNVGSVILNSPVEPINETISILKKQLSIITIASLFIGTILALFLAKLFTNPILKITEASKKIAKGNFDVSIPVNSQDEISVLSETINDMTYKLGQIENFRKEFIANVSHELKTPISLIRAYGELVMDIDDRESKNEYVQVIIDESNRLNTMVEEILFLSQIETGYLKLNKVQFFIVNILDSVVEKLEFFAQKKNINILIEMENKDLQVYADANKLYQVFFNLINNSITHSHENSTVKIIVLDEKNKIKIEIMDNGIGISKEEIPYIWDRFYKVDKSRKRNNSGTGLGMAIVKNILEIHEFEYGIESELNRGTTVWIEMKKAL